MRGLETAPERSCSTRWLVSRNGSKKQYDEDMGFGAISGVRMQYVRHFDCAVLIVHHCGLLVIDPRAYKSDRSR